MNDQELKQGIAASLHSFAGKQLPEAARDFFAALGYHSQRRLTFPSTAKWLAEFDKEGKTAKYFPQTAAANRGDAVLVQQLTSAEIASNSLGQLELAPAAKADLRQLDSYLFVAVPLSAAEYTRTELAERARALNTLFAQPVLILFRHGHCISLAITYRRMNKREQARDVIERKVTLIKDISCAQPHPGHLAILQDFSLAALSRARQRDIKTFADLDNAWRESLSTQLLNQQFYDEIANWYFWARELWKIGEIRLPADIKSEADASLFLIRLLTRLIFCWFLREKINPQTGQGLIPDELFEARRLPELIPDAAPDGSAFYTAILQNLFFATLNTEMDTHGEEPARRFLDAGDGLRSDDHMVHQLWRHEDKLKDRKTFEAIFRRIPFLNGGLFECLDDRVPKGNSAFTTEIRLDGFSSDPRKQPMIPNRLFYGRTFDETYPVNLSEAYGDSARSKVNVRPLLEIFRRFKFTLTENTPIEEEVALDPELLGHVFENLLAAYNPETGMVARKSTGSFYTPRVVVDWMVDEALLVYLGNRVPEVAEEKLRDLLSWNPISVELTQQQANALIDAVHSLKALDPACGSGAFPMGLLQKLVHLLKQIDPGNKRWQALQVDAAQALPSAPAREAALAAIKLAFTRDNDDYGRKLYLIENCLYGVDIQPIAVQIAKLRFFIALIVDQRIVPKEVNYGILALPNLETKIVAANTLLGLKRGQLQLGSDKARKLERELQQVRHNYFTARTYSEKKRLRKRDKELCDQLSEALVFSEELSPSDSKRVTGWNPYRADKPATFFDAGWMFGLPAKQDDGVFDLVIGNPPYVRQEELKNQIVQDSTGKATSLKDVLKTQYACFTGTADLYVYFYERSFQLLRTRGVLSFITSNKYFRAAYGERLRTYLLYASHPKVLLDFGDSPVFTAVAYPCILVAEKIRHVNKGGLPDPDEIKQPGHLVQLVNDLDRTFRVMTWTPGPPLHEFPLVFEDQAFLIKQRDLRPSAWKFQTGEASGLRRRLETSTTPLGRYANELVFNGVKSGHKDAFTLSPEKRDLLVLQDPNARKLLKPLLKGRDIKRWRVEPTSRWLLYIPWHFPLGDDATVDPASPAAEAAFRQRFPKILNHLSQFRNELEQRDQSEIGIRYEWFCLSRPRPEAASFFDKPKIVFPDIAAGPCFAWDDDGHAIENTAYMIPGQKWLLAVLNSPPVFWFYCQISNTIRGGFVRFIRQYVEQIPVPRASPDQQRWCESLVDALLCLNRPATAAGTNAAPASLMVAYFEEWLNGLVYELFFTSELHARNLRLFDETAELAPPLLGKKSKTQNITQLKELFDKAYDPNAKLRGMLHSLRSLETVRIIEAVAPESNKEQEEL